MAKKIYQIPSNSVKNFMKNNSTLLNIAFSNPQSLEYNVRFGKSYYNLEIQKFLIFFKISNNHTYALKTISHFSSSDFFEKVFTLLNFSQFTYPKVTNRDLFYFLCFILVEHNRELFELFLHQLFLHYFGEVNKQSDTNIDYKELSLAILKQHDITHKESFGEKEEKSFFKITLEDNTILDETGKSIKTLRKKIYKRLFFKLIDNQVNFDIKQEKKNEAYQKVTILREL